MKLKQKLENFIIDECNKDREANEEITTIKDLKEAYEETKDTYQTYNSWLIETALVNDYQF